jgi:hypothetical protein
LKSANVGWMAAGLLISAVPMSATASNELVLADARYQDHHA